MEIGFLQEIKAIIKSLVLSSPERISIDKLNRDFKEIDGYQIPYGKLGFNSLEQFLRSIPDTVKVEGKGTLATLQFVANRKSDHIHEMIKTQKKSRRRPRSASQFQGQNRIYNAPRNFTKRENQGFNRSRYNHRNVAYANKHQAYTGSNTLNKKYDDIPPVFLADDEISEMVVTFEDAVKISSNHVGSSVSAHKKFQFSENNDAAKPTIDQKNANFLIKSVPHSSRSKSYLESNVILPTKNVLNEINIKMPHENCTTDGKNPKIQIRHEEYEFKLKVPKEQNSFSSRNKNTSNLISVDDGEELVSDSSKKMYNLLYDQYDTLSTSRKSICYHKPTEIQKVPEANFFQDAFSSKDKYDDINEAVPKFAADNLVFRIDFPNNTVMFGQKILPYKLPNDLKKGSIIGIFISEIHNPFKFWFHIHKENHELDLLMHHIERFYMSLEQDELMIPEECHSRGQICAALYNNLWHRAEIIAEPINMKTKVFFLDYGTVSEVNSDDIKYLASKFATIPSQAIRGSLSHIKPRGLHWSHAATKYFLSLVCELMLYAQVADVDRQNRVLHLIICNTNGPEATQVNKSMVENGHAFYYAEWMEQRIAKNGLRWHHPREDFPTFEMIEAGQYPSLSDLLYLLQMGIDYEKIIDGIVFNYGKLNINENAPEALRNLPFHLLNTNPFKCDIIFELYRPVKLI